MVQYHVRTHFEFRESDVLKIEKKKSCEEYIFSPIKIKTSWSNSADLEGW